MPCQGTSDQGLPPAASGPLAGDMPQPSVLRLAPQRVVNSVVAALLLTTPTLAPGSTTPPAQASVTLAESATAGQIAAQLPLTVTFHDRMGTAVFAQLATPLAVDAADPMSEYRAGDIAYFAAERSLVVFLSGGAAVPDPGLTLVGHLAAGLDQLADCPHGCTIALAIASTS